MVAADLTLTAERSEVVDFALPYLTHSLSVLMKKLPDVGQQGPVGILAAFDILVKLRTHRCPLDAGCSFVLEEWVFLRDFAAGCPRI